jgi:hypothetical protein
MLETERYEEAMALLRFLGKCDSGDPRTNEEWVALLAWLETMKSGDVRVEVSEEQGEMEETEEDLFREHLRMRTEHDPDYLNQLMDMLQADVAESKQLLALDQLAYWEEAANSKYHITEALIEWVESAMLSPWVQFKALQTLKIRGFQGEIHISKEGIKLNLDVAQIPLELNQYPANIGRVLHKLQQVAEINEPSLSYFAEEIWEQFLAYVYGMSVYDQLTEGNTASIVVWAAALHCIIDKLMTGTLNETEIQIMYGMPEESKLQWKQVFQALQSFSVQIPLALK